MPGATDRIAAKLAARKAQQAQAPSSNGTEAAPMNGEADDDELVAEPEHKPTLAERAKAARAAKAAAKSQPKEPEPEAEAEEDDEDEEEVHPAEEAALSAARQEKKPKTSVGKVAKKKAPSKAQLAAREKFAARSRERAAAAKAEKEAPAEAPVKGKGRQSPEDIKAAQRKKRDEEQAAAKAEAEARTSRPRTAKATKSKAAPPTKIKVASGKAKAAAPSAKATGKPAGTKRSGDTKKAVLALWNEGKGKSRAEIMAELNLSYASVFFHTKGHGKGTGARGGGIIVETNLDADGKKLRNGKTVKVGRSEAMRRTYKSGKSVGDTARAFDVRYQLAYTAIKPLLG